MKHHIIISLMLLLPLAAFAQQNDSEYPQFSGDSLLLVMVDFPNLQFQHSAAEIQSAVADYACNGKRVVGPYHMPAPPSSYSNFETTFLQFSLDVYDSAAADVDMSHFPFDSIHKNMVIIYPGAATVMAQQNSIFAQISGILYSFEGPDKNLYYTFASEKMIFDIEGDTNNATYYAGDIISIMMVNHPEYYAPKYLFHGYGSSIIERAATGCATIDTLTAAADSIELKVVTGHNDKGYYISLSDDEFLLLEAHAMRQGSNTVANDGMYIFHGSDSIYTYYRSDNSSIYNREYVPFGAHIYPDTVFYYMDSADFGWGLPYMGGTSLSPQSSVKPRLLDTTAVMNDVWITNIRWKNDSVMLFDFNSDKPAVEIPYRYHYSDTGGLNTIVLRAKIISRTGNVATKGIIYALTEAGCNMEQGTVVYDTSVSTEAIAANTSGLANGTTYYYRAFASDGTHTSYSPVKQLTMNKHVALRHVKRVQGGKYLLDLELREDVSHCLYSRYVDDLIMLLGKKRCLPSYWQDNWDVIDVSGPIIEECVVDSATNQGTFGLWVITSEGDTVIEMFKFSLTGIDTIQLPDIHEQLAEDVVTDEVISLVGNVGLTGEQDETHIWIGLVPRNEIFASFAYYTPYECYVTDVNTGCDTAASIKYTTNYSFVHHLLSSFAFAEVDSTGNVNLPLLPSSSDSLLVLVAIDQYGVAHVREWRVHVDLPVNQAIGAAHLGYENFDGSPLSPQFYGYYETVFTTDSTLHIYVNPNEYANHYYMLYGTVSELAALGVTDTSTAVAYLQTHQSAMHRYECPWVSMWWGSRPINHTYTLTGVIPYSDYHVYLFPFNANNVAGKVERLVFEVKDKFVDVTPGGNGDTAWWYSENGEVVWAWKYDENEIMDDYHMYLAPLGRLDSLCTAMGVDPVGLLPSLVQAGLTRNYGDNLPWSSALFDVGDTALHLLPDTTYELCLWATDYYGTAYFQRTPFSTHGAPRFNEAGLKELYFERDYHSNGDTVFYCLIQATEATAYYHVILGEEGVLSAQGITSLADASEYCLSHRSSLEQYTHQTTEISFEAGTDDMGYSNYALYMEFIDGTPYMRPYYCWRKHNTQPMSRDSVYRIYVIPYTAAGEQGVGRYIRFSPYYGQYDYSDSAVYGYVTESSVSDITENSATLHGNVQAGRRSISVVGFSYLRADAPWGTEASTVVFGPYTGDPFSYRLTGLQPNTTYRYAVAMGHGTDTSVYSSVIYNTFTTASCTVSVSIDTTICYNTYYGSQRYTSSQTLEFAYIAANGCDSVLSVNLTVLPQRIGKDTVVLCYGEEYDGFPRYNSFIQTETIQEEGLCDSTHRVRLEVLAKIETSASDTLYGDTYEWGNQVLTQPGQYTQVFTAANGCDSTVHLTLVAEPEEPQEGIGDVDIDRVRIYVDGRTIVVDGSEGWTVNIYDASGRLLFTKTDGIRYDAPSTGTYFVQVGNHPARKVVMVR